MTVVVEATNPVQPSAEPRFRWRSFMRHRSGVIGFVMLLTTVVVAVFAPFIAPYDPYAPVQITIDDIFQAPSPAHLLGTDDAGKDVLSSLIYGARVSLIVGFTAAAIAIFIGALIGIVAGYQRGWIGSLLMRITDVFLVIPDLALMIVLVAILGPSLRTIILVIGILGWTGTARLVRAQTLSVRERKYVLRAKAVGANDAHVLRHHILPAVLPADAGQHGARREHRDPRGVAASPSWAWATRPSSAGARCSTSPSTAARSAPAHGGRFSRRASRSCGSCSARRCSARPSRTR